VILRSTNIRSALRSRQRGFLLDPYRFGAGGGSPPTFKSSAANGIGTVANGDFVRLFFLGAGAAAPSAPSGWTRIVNTSEANGYAVAVYDSIYSGSNAAADATNFPVANGYFQTVVYDGALSSLQIGTLSDGSGNSRTVTALTNPTGAASALIAWYSSRDPATVSITSSESMTQTLLADAYTFFDSATWEQLGVQSGNRTFNRVGASFNHFGMLFEIG
jgi:hypothetical protein